MHWFDLPTFYQAVGQVLKPCGVIAVWIYHLPIIEPTIDPVIAHFYGEVAVQRSAWRWASYARIHVHLGSTMQKLPPRAFIKHAILAETLKTKEQGERCLSVATIVL